MDSTTAGFVTFPIETGLLHSDDDGRHRALVFGFSAGTVLDLPGRHTHFGVVVSGEVEVTYLSRRRVLQAGDFFSTIGPGTVRSSSGAGVVTSAYGYHGMNVFGGEIEAEGRLRYIDGCTDTVLVPPVRKGDPCFNHLHMPGQVIQTPHTHPSVRVGVIYRGAGECVLPEGSGPIPLTAGNVFVLRANTVHSFNTPFSEMDIIAFHPDSDTGATDDDHPMVNRTIVNGISASSISSIRTVADG